jgi:hypothetical protein
MTIQFTLNLEVVIQEQVSGVDHKLINYLMVHPWKWAKKVYFYSRFEKKFAVFKPFRMLLAFKFGKSALIPFKNLM